ncbi:hypothetical protein L6452_05800 [Arctium lappa]|uniref:Uncharacterized protein n=1 Tax=Arctium lappa TaxID=4217 RepID=A0ACB9EIG3_ARCLA|nr:hypothetical protein L6452_05800 [Arctium lappa]
MCKLRMASSNRFLLVFGKMMNCQRMSSPRLVDNLEPFHVFFSWACHGKGNVGTSSKQRKKQVDLGKEKLGTDSHVETHVELTISLKVQPNEPNVQHYDDDNMAKLWKEVPIFTLSAPSPIVQQEYKPDEWNSETHNTQNFVEHNHFENVAINEDEPIYLLEWPHEITPPQTIQSPEGTTTVFANDTIIPSTTIVTELPPEHHDTTTVFNMVFTTVFSNESQSPTGMSEPQPPIWNQNQTRQGIFMQTPNLQVGVLESMVNDQERRWKEALDAQKLGIIKHFRDCFGWTTGLSENANDNATLREENEKLKQELEDLKARKRTSSRKRRGGSTPTPRE